MTVAARDEFVWSTVDGRARRVRIPRSTLPVGHEPTPVGMVVLASVLFLAFGWSLAAAVAGLFGRFFLPVFLALVLVLFGIWGAKLRSWWNARRQYPELASQRRTFPGRVVHRWTETVWGSNADYEQHYLAVDDGQSDEALAWEVGERMYETFAPGRAVQVTIGYNRGLISIAAGGLALEPFATATAATAAPVAPTRKASPWAADRGLRLVTGTYLLMLGAVWTTAEIRGGTWPSPAAEVIAWVAFFAVQFGLFTLGSYLGWGGVLWMDLFLLPLSVVLGLLLAVAWLDGGAAGSTMAFALFVALLLAAVVPLVWLCSAAPWRPLRAIGLPFVRLSLRVGAWVARAAGRHTAGAA